jgi:ABC-type transport system involved in multi-copper enzyme maturation permease subunit
MHGGVIMGKRKFLSLTITVGLLTLFFFVCLPGISLSADSPSAQVPKQQENPYAKAEITIQIIPSANNTFGYDILLYKRVLVHQPNMPVLLGNEGFSTKEKAQTVAEFVVKKIRNNQMPPTVTMEDLNTLGVLK